MTDFELAAIKAFKETFPGVKNKGCMFHFGQNIMKYLSSIGLKSNYIEDTDFKQWINSIFALALCPLNKLDDQWEKCLNNQPKNVLRIEEFLDYFVDNYFEGDFPKEMWNHFGNENLPRTNNNLEGYNGKLKKYIVISYMLHSY
ncbi:unnamed protein product [Brachionus calyciflorus]|uniref:MULE transposase domain-containing protein n=1 Tax=Brachionus calyciflorus TaxID=104777 RepID=A0A814NYE8_9BILA|nr:unnamed protein product [Brachionus calyciflorus]